MRTGPRDVTIQIVSCFKTIEILSERVTDLHSGQVHEGMNRPFYASASNSSTIRQSPSQPPPSVKASVHDRHTHSRNTSDPQDYHRRPPPPPALPRHDDEDTQDTDEDEESGMTAYGTSRSGAPSSLPAGSAGSRPGSSHKDSGAAVKKPKTKSTKVFQCTGYGDCTMQFTRSEHLARHIRYSDM